jgi:hypothetical protein
MFRLVTDNDFDGRILDALLQFQPDLDVVRVQEIGLAATPDPEILAWAAMENRIVLTHDKRTMTKYANERLTAGLTHPGVFLVPNNFPQIGAMARNIELIMECSSQEEWENQVLHLPL